MQVIERAKSARVDLFGGTLDIPPINLILEGVVTLNAAISLKSKVLVRESTFAGLEIFSNDYGVHKQIPFGEWTKENIYIKKSFQEFTFVAQILEQFPWPSQTQRKGLALEFTSDIPPGSGLGGSSVMGLTLYEALCVYFQQEVTTEEILRKVQGIEAKILDCGPTGYQDYYPALYGGVLALLPYPEKVDIQQLYTPQLKEYLESHLTLVYSGQTRFSGMNNWEVYKAFFDRKESVRTGLQDLANLSSKAFEVLRSGELQSLSSLIAQEGVLRQKLFAQIATPAMNNTLTHLQRKLPHLGMKVCGAGGGGCFLLSHRADEAEWIARELPLLSMKKLEFKIDNPIP